MNRPLSLRFFGKNPRYKLFLHDVLSNFQNLMKKFDVWGEFGRWENHDLEEKNFFKKFV